MAAADLEMLAEVVLPEGRGNVDAERAGGALGVQVGEPVERLAHCPQLLLELCEVTAVVAGQGADDPGLAAGDGKVRATD
jgi:hypothetical protein